MDRRNTSSSFWIRCVGYTQPYESVFTIGKEYEVSGGRVTNDRGYIYTDPTMEPDSNPADWYLSSWYRFEIINNDVAIPTSLDISFEDVLGQEVFK